MRATLTIERGKLQDVNDPDINSLMRAAAALQQKYAQSDDIPTEQLVRDMRELLSTERVVLDAIITLFVKLGHAGVVPHGQ